MQKLSYLAKSGALLMCLTVVTACVSTRADRIGTDTSDQCYQYREVLDSTGNHFEEDIVEGALIGAATGFVGGLLLGGDLESAAIGAGAGLIAGGLGGYWNAKVQQNQEQAVLGLVSDLDAETQNLTKTERALRLLIRCRVDQARDVRTAYRGGQITGEEANRQLTDLRTKYEQDKQIARSIQEDIAPRSGEFLVASEAVNPGSSRRIETGYRNSASYRENQAWIAEVTDVAYADAPPARKQRARQEAQQVVQQQAREEVITEQQRQEVQSTVATVEVAEPQAAQVEEKTNTSYQTAQNVEAMTDSMDLFDVAFEPVDGTAVG